MSENPLHSVVVPVFNESAVLEQFLDRCERAMRSIGDDFEIVFVDDGSVDDSWALLETLSATHPHVRLVQLSRNFGHQIAITAGIEYANGDTVTTIDADLQDPPEVIALLVDRWRQGADVVYARRGERKGETWFKVTSADAFYRIIAGLSDIRLPRNVGDFRLLSRRAVDALISMPEQHRYVRGLVAWIGYESASVDYSREARAAGVTKYPMRKMLQLASDGILAFSNRPLQMATWLGLFVSTAAFLLAGFLIVARMAGAYAVQGWTSVVVLVLLLSGVQLITIGALGEYVGRIYTDVRKRPLYLVKELRGFEHPSRRQASPDLR